MENTEIVEVAKEVKEVIIVNKIKSSDYYKLITNTLQVIEKDKFPIKVYFVKGTIFERAVLKGNANIVSVRSVSKATHVCYAGLKSSHRCLIDDEIYYKLTANEIETVRILSSISLPIIEVNVLFDYVYEEEDVSLLKDGIVWNKELIPYFDKNMERYRYRTVSVREKTILNKYKNCIRNAT